MLITISEFSNRTGISRAALFGALQRGVLADNDIRMDAKVKRTTRYYIEESDIGKITRKIKEQKKAVKPKGFYARYSNLRAEVDLLLRDRKLPSAQQSIYNEIKYQASKRKANRLWLQLGFPAQCVVWAVWRQGDVVLALKIVDRIVKGLCCKAASDII